MDSLSSSAQHQVVSTLNLIRALPEHAVTYSYDNEIDKQAVLEKIAEGVYDLFKYFLVGLSDGHLASLKARGVEFNSPYDDFKTPTHAQLDTFLHKVKVHVIGGINHGDNITFSTDYGPEERLFKILKASGIETDCFKTSLPHKSHVQIIHKEDSREILLSMSFNSHRRYYH